MSTDNPTEKTSIAQRMKDVVGKALVSTIDLQPIVTKNIDHFLVEMAAQKKIKKDQLLVRIFPFRDQIGVWLHANGKLIKKLSIAEMMLFFIGNSAMITEKQVIDSIWSFFDHYSKEKEIPVLEVQLFICSTAHGLIIQSYRGRQLIEQVDLKRLINFFQS